MLSIKYNVHKSQRVYNTLFGMTMFCNNIWEFSTNNHPLIPLGLDLEDNPMMRYGFTDSFVIHLLSCLSFIRLDLVQICSPVKNIK